MVCYGCGIFLGVFPGGDSKIRSIVKVKEAWNDMAPHVSSYIQKMIDGRQSRERLRPEKDL
jgi:hypothetical protein